MTARQSAEKAKRQRAFGQRPEAAKMSSAGLYVRVSTHDQETLSLQMALCGNTPLGAAGRLSGGVTVRAIAVLRPDACRMTAGEQSVAAFPVTQGRLRELAPLFALTAVSTAEGSEVPIGRRRIKTPASTPMDVSNPRCRASVTDGVDFSYITS